MRGEMRLSWVRLGIGQDRLGQFELDLVGQVRLGCVILFYLLLGEIRSG